MDDRKSEGLSEEIMNLTTFLIQQIMLSIRKVVKSNRLLGFRFGFNRNNTASHIADDIYQFTAGRNDNLGIFR